MSLCQVLRPQEINTGGTAIEIVRLAGFGKMRKYEFAMILSLRWPERPVVNMGMDD